MCSSFLLRLYSLGMQHGNPESREIERLEHQLLRLEGRVDGISDLLMEILRALAKLEIEVEPRLASIKIKFKGVSMPNPGPLTLTAAGQTATAVIVGFDQHGNPWTGAIPTATFAGDNDGFATVDPTSGLVTAVANGTVNLTGSLTTVEGLSLSDVEQVIVAIPVEVPVLSAIKVQFN